MIKTIVSLFEPPPMETVNLVKNGTTLETTFERGSSLNKWKLAAFELHFAGRAREPFKFYFISDCSLSRSASSEHTFRRKWRAHQEAHRCSKIIFEKEIKFQHRSNFILEYSQILMEFVFFLFIFFYSFLFFLFFNFKVYAFCSLQRVGARWSYLSFHIDYSREVARFTFRWECNFSMSKKLSSIAKLMTRM